MYVQSSSLHSECIWLHNTEPSERHAALCFAHSQATLWCNDIIDQISLEQEIEEEKIELSQKRRSKKKKKTAMRELLIEKNEAMSLCEELEKRVCRESLSSKITALCRKIHGSNSEQAKEESLRLIRMSIGNKKIEQWETSEVLMRRLLTTYGSEAYRSENIIPKNGTTSATVSSASGVEEDGDDFEQENFLHDELKTTRGEVTVGVLLTRVLRQIVENHERALQYLKKEEFVKEMVLSPGRIRQSLVYAWLMESIYGKTSSRNENQEEKETQKEEKSSSGFTLNLNDSYMNEEEDLNSFNGTDGVDGVADGVVLSMPLKNSNLKNVHVVSVEEKIFKSEIEVQNRIAFTLSVSCWPYKEEEEEEEESDEDGDDTIDLFSTTLELLELENPNVKNTKPVIKIGKK